MWIRCVRYFHAGDEVSKSKSGYSGRHHPSSGRPALDDIFQERSLHWEGIYI